ncbi:MAG: hypothetical protein J6W84_10205 [Bacteroidales bacterium]|nr:hypothetical protein [Bacteroidales bacterium]
MNACLWHAIVCTLLLPHISCEVTENGSLREQRPAHSKMNPWHVRAAACHGAARCAARSLTPFHARLTLAPFALSLCNGFFPFEKLKGRNEAEAYVVGTAAGAAIGNMTFIK